MGDFICCLCRLICFVETMMCIGSLKDGWVLEKILMNDRSK